MARKFLYIVAVLIVLALAATFAYRIWGAELLRIAMVPGGRFESQAALPADSYKRAEMWLARPDKPGNPALWAPEGYSAAKEPTAAVFFIHPTSYPNRAHWNAPLEDKEANDRAALFLRGQASAFNGAGAVWAPRYRQATFGAFLTSKEDAQRALDLAYRDVTAAFDQFLAEAGDRPIILAGHSQGALHLTRLLHDRVAGKPIAKRIVAAYVVGWPVSKSADLPKLGLAECTAADQTGCILSWQSFAEPADPSLLFDTFDASNGFTGQKRAGTPMICTNPITGTPGVSAEAAANRGSLIPNVDFSNATLLKGAVAARCSERGILLIGNPPENLSGQYVLWGNNYHVFDYSLFWANVRADIERRLKAFKP
ncbi:DUF3089 domain-containing protein [Sphingomonas koreensis]|uniref:DUF3089 domain-containing protein n=1 Tax=Sphingomonas koreensis TaxID=93064 RepID=A0A1L6JCU2_9SPHN|nr:DUF3089 domain-containing protein [Sphingomonas koreensis]APR53310.1 hypothetical protein BRX40_13515 [Sphingomonas koreensis]MDC7810005.1 DUF3089 domain-containing protein [Sphingomonas koreensis]RSU24571.1 DUF3089 domain-containing protein [Sphingomonas koreensis]RSU25216.1 DUF3089 domain-containing protein [Sphingomonas koreensis]RSU30109.1 DUF3089 domain-containing protein [Sphingomonas koreensis]